MNNSALLKIEQEQKPLIWLKQQLGLPDVELSLLPAKISKRLWVGPEEFLEVTAAPDLAHWALNVSGSWRTGLPAQRAVRRGPKLVDANQLVIRFADRIIM